MPDWTLAEAPTLANTAGHVFSMGLSCIVPDAYGFPLRAFSAGAPGFSWAVQILLDRHPAWQIHPEFQHGKLGAGVLLFPN